MAIASVLCIIINKSVLNCFVPVHKVVPYMCGSRKRWHYSKIRGHESWSHLLMKVSCASRTWLRVTLYVAFHLDDGELLCTSKFNNRSVKQHLIWERQHRYHYQFISHDQIFSLYKNPTEKNRSFLRTLVICQRGMALLSVLGAVLLLCYLEIPWAQ